MTQTKNSVWALAVQVVAVQVAVLDDSFLIWIWGLCFFFSMLFHSMGILCSVTSMKNWAESFNVNPSEDVHHDHTQMQED